MNNELFNNVSSYIETGDYRGSLRAPETMSPLGVIKPKAMKNDKGREGDLKIVKMSRRCLWMASKTIRFLFRFVT